MTIEDDWVLLADEHVVAIDKPSGVLSDASRDPNRDHLGAALGRWAKRNGEPSTFLAAHRLDLGTSGVVLFARSRDAATALMQQFQARSVNKRYQAIVGSAGFAQHEVGDRVERRSYLRHRKGVSEEVRSGGKTAETSFELVTRTRHLALVHARPATGRTHQLRVHLAALGSPILGDDRYGTHYRWPPEVDTTTRLWLHAESLAIDHPVSLKRLELHSRQQLSLTPQGPQVAHQSR